MKPLPASAGVVAAVVALASSVSDSHARSRSLESLGCLFELGKPRFDLPRVQAPVIAFSFLPLAERLISHSQSRNTPSAFVAQTAAPEEPFNPTEFATSFNAPLQPIGPESPPDPIDEWPLIQSLRRFRTNPHVDGFSHNVGTANSYVALDYSDIFESGRAPYKGSHGVSLFFRHDF